MDHQPDTEAPVPPVKIKHAHNFIFIYACLIIFFAALGGIYTWQHNKVTALQKDNQTLTSKIAAATSPRSFYDCVDAGGTTSKTSPLTCTVFGRSYTFPTTFNIFQVDNLAQVPSAALPLIKSIGQTNFQQCAGNLPETYPSMYITLAQHNFVDVGVGCDSGHHEYLGLNGSTWVDLGGGQAGLSCALVSKYKIIQSSLVSSQGSAGDTTCTNPNGTEGIVPAI